MKCFVVFTQVIRFCFVFKYASFVNLLQICFNTTFSAVMSNSYTLKPIDISNEGMLKEFGRTGSYVLSEETRNQITESHNQKQVIQSIPLPKNYRKHTLGHSLKQTNRFLNQQYESDINPEETQRLLQELNPNSRNLERPLLDIRSAGKPYQMKSSVKPAKKPRKHVVTRTAPATGFKSLYQLSLMLGKGFNIDELYLVQDSFSKETLSRQSENNFGPLPFSTVNPPVTIVPLKPQIPSTKFELLPIDYVATIKPIRKEVKQMFHLDDSYTFDEELEATKIDLPVKNARNDMIKAIDPELAQVDSEINEVKRFISSKLSVKMSSRQESGDLEIRSNPYIQRKSSTTSLRAQSSNNSLKPVSSTRTFWVGSSSSNSISNMSKCGLLRKDIYDDSDEESTPESSENESILDEEEEEDMMSDVEENEKSFEFNKEKHGLKMDLKQMGVHGEIVMCNYGEKNAFNVFKEPSNSSELPSSRESTKANASLTSRVGLEDVNSDNRSDEGQMQSSERAHPLCNTVTAGTVMKTYAKAIGKDNPKSVNQRSNTFSGLESKSKKGKDRLAVSYPTMFDHNK